MLRGTTKLFTSFCVSVPLLAIGLTAPIWHDEAIVLVEFSGLHSWPQIITPSSVAKAEDLRGDPGIVELFSNISRLAFQMTPPLHYVFLWLWRHIAGGSLISLRFLSLLCWLAVLVVFWLWCRSRLALILLALSPAGIQFATLARGYALTILWILLTAWLLDPERAGSFKGAILGSICAALAVWTHYLAVLPVVVIILYWAVRMWRIGNRQAVVPIVFLAALGLPVGYFVLAQLRPSPGHFTGWIQESYSICRTVFRLPFNASLATGRALDLSSSFIFLVGILACIASFQSRSFKVRLSLLVIGSQVPFLLLVGYFTHNDLGAERYLGLTLPFCYLLLADLCDRFKGLHQYWEYALIAIALISCGGDALQILRIEKAQQRYLDPLEAGPMVVMVNSREESGVVAEILHDTPDHADFVVLPPGANAAIESALMRYRTIWNCPSEEGLPENEKIRLFREYSCNRIATPQR